MKTKAIPTADLTQWDTMDRRTVARRCSAAVSLVVPVLVWSATSADDTQPCRSFKSLVGYYFPCSFTLRVAQTGKQAPVLHNDPFHYKRDKSCKHSYIGKAASATGSTPKCVIRKCYWKTFLKIGWFVSVVMLCYNVILFNKISCKNNDG